MQYKYILLFLFIFFSKSAFSQAEGFTYNGKKVSVEDYLKIAKENETSGDMKEASRFINEVATLYWKNKDYEKALNYYQESVKLNESINNQHGIIGIYGNMAMIYADKKDYESSLKLFEKTLAYKKKGTDKYNISSVLINTSVVLNNLGQHDKAGEYLEEALQLSKELNDLSQMRSVYGMLSETYEKAENPDLMLKYFELYRTFHEKVQRDKEVVLKETAEKANLRARLVELEKRNSELKLKAEILDRDETLVHYDSANKRMVRESSRQEGEIRNLTEAQKAQVAEHEVKIAEHKAKQHEQKIVNRFLIGGSVLLLLGGLIFYRNSRIRKKINNRLKESNRQISKANQIVNDQKAELEMVFADLQHKNENITKSIAYAERIQQAMLKSGDLLAEYLPSSFILFRPRDVVSGDFYWASQQNGKVIVASVDCTGHGVPGAFMSMIGANLLNQIVESEGENSPEKILLKLHQGVNKALHQEDTENNDGMDASIISIDKANKTMEFAGAHNPLIYFQGGEVTQIKGTKQGIGGATLKRGKEVEFEKHIISIDQPTTFYLFTDGYQDQFGGEEDKKFSIKRMRGLLGEIHQKKSILQREILGKTIADWMRGTSKQIDDILVIGGKIE
jgi:serine phosphatase RsbU (regulator of sigma subunit)